MPNVTSILDSVLALAPNEKTRNVVATAAGMLTVLTGQKVLGLGLFGKGIYGLEQQWRKDHPDFDGNLVDRWNKAIEFYEQTHANDTNRKLHIIGIPMIVGGTAGLLLFRPFRPLWMMSASSFSLGWILNFVGHGIYEKRAPAFADDPLSFIAGPVWDFQQVFGKKGTKAQAAKTRAHTPEGAMTTINVEPSEAAVA